MRVQGYGMRRSAGQARDYGEEYELTQFGMPQRHCDARSAHVRGEGVREAMHQVADLGYSQRHHYGSQKSVRCEEEGSDGYRTDTDREVTQEDEERRKGIKRTPF